MNLNDEQKENCISAGKYGFDAKKVAALLMLTVQEVNNALNDPSSEICKHYEHGKAVFMFDPFLTLEKKAIAGDRHAAKDLMKLRRDLIVDQMTDEFLGGR
jgi:hypothetical protein